MGEQKPLRERPERERWLSKKQYEMLRRCSDKKDVSEWNDWREKYPNEPVLLEGAHLNKARLAGADFDGTILEGVHLVHAHLEGATFRGSVLKNVQLHSAHLQEASFSGAQLEGSRLWLAHVERAVFRSARLSGALFYQAHLEGADFGDAHLEGAHFREAHLEGTKFNMAVVDGETLLDTGRVDKQTDFTGVALANARIPPGLKQLLEYNVRRLGWEKWYQEHQLLRGPVWLFWFMSDYGRSTGRVLGCFFGLAAAFALIYWVCSLASDPAIVSNLLSRDNIPVPGWLLPFRALYFSIVTMTTLGFGDIYAYPKSLAGHLLLTLQVLLGYVLLAALVTHFAVLFTAGGPAGKFADEKSLLSRLWSRVRVRDRENRPARPLLERLREEARKFQRRFRG